MRNNQTRYIVVLIVALIIIAIVGRFFSTRTSNQETSTENSSDTVRFYDVNGQPSDVSDSSSSNASTSVKTPATALSTSTQCIATLQADVKSKHISYDPASILVTFNVGVGYPEAMAYLASRNLSPKDQDAKGSYDYQRLIVTAVPNEKVIETICVLRSDVVVKYAGFNTLFNLHE